MSSLSPLPPHLVLSAAPFLVTFTAEGGRIQNIPVTTWAEGSGKSAMLIVEVVDDGVSVVLQAGSATSVPADHPDSSLFKSKKDAANGISLVMHAGPIVRNSVASLRLVSDADTTARCRWVPSQSL